MELKAKTTIKFSIMELFIDRYGYQFVMLRSGCKITLFFDSFVIRWILTLFH